MEITDEIKKEVIDEEKENDIFLTLLQGKTAKETIETSRGKFVVLFPKQKDLVMIDKRVAIMRGNIPASSFDANANFALQKIAFLDTVIESGDDWFNVIRDKNKNFSWGDMPDADFVDEVYVKAWSFRCKVQASFRKHEEKTDSGTTDAENVSENVGDGLFSDVTATVK